MFDVCALVGTTAFSNGDNISAVMVRACSPQVR